MRFSHICYLTTGPPPPRHWNYNGAIRQKRDLVIAFDWEVLLTWSTHLNCILQDFFRDTPLDYIWRAQICAQRIKGRQICFEWLNHGRNYFFLVRKLWYLKECLMVVVGYHNFHFFMLNQKNGVKSAVKTLDMEYHNFHFLMLNKKRNKKRSTNSILVYSPLSLPILPHYQNHHNAPWIYFGLLVRSNQVAPK